MPGNPSFSSSETDASTFSHLQELAVQPAGKIREPVVFSAYVIAGTALVNDVGATENKVDAWDPLVRRGGRRRSSRVLVVFHHP